MPCLGIWRHIEKLNGKKASAYIYRIALTANSKAWRNRIGKDGQISQAQSNTAKDPSQETIEDELAKMIKRAISQLPARQSRAVVMRYLEQQSYEIIAEKLHCSEAGARSNVSKALATLKRTLSNE